MRTDNVLSTEQKALKLNLQPTIYGVFAEIGAGQEVVNHFYKAGAASGTIAKSISAYDMMVSDSIYGRTKRYVSKERLSKMLSLEYNALISNLSLKASSTHFFAFGNTVSTTSFSGQNKGRGWMGVKFQTAPNQRPKELMIHLLFHTNDPVIQRKIIGTIGVNLIYGVFEHLEDPEILVCSLLDNVDSSLVEINFIESSRFTFEHYNNKELSFLLVKKGLTKMIMIDANGEIVQPMSTIRKKDLLLVRGRFRPPTRVTLEMFKKSKEQMTQLHQMNGNNILAVAEITLRCYKDESEMTIRDYLERIELLSALKIPVIITNFKYHVELINFLQSYCQLNSLNLVLGSENLMKVFEGKDHHEEFGAFDLIKALQNSNGHIFLFPQLRGGSHLIGLNELPVNESANKLVEYMKCTDLISEVQDIDMKLLNISSDQVLSMLRHEIPDWQQMVPEDAVLLLKSKKLFRHGINDSYSQFG